MLARQASASTILAKIKNEGGVYLDLIRAIEIL
jgi:hypothetical protein